MNPTSPKMTPKRRSRGLAVKRAFDIAFALPTGVAALPLLGISALVVKIASPEAPVMFRQERIGYRGEPFTMLKLRTMTDERDELGRFLPDEQRLRPWGKMLRRLSVDELPQILHILFGQMSWIGPRPLLPQEMGVMTGDEQLERQSMRPGITGWEAVNEEKSTNRREMAEYDLWYVRNWTMGLDARIFWLTVSKLFRADRSDDEHRAPKLVDADLRIE